MKVEIGKGNYEFKCLADGCQSAFPLSVVYNVLDPKTFDIVMAKRQEIEIMSAGIENLESCPHCPYAVEFENKATFTCKDTILRCDNPSCGKITCR